jgi:hypothetical protein
VTTGIFDGMSEEELWQSLDAILEVNPEKDASGIAKLNRLLAKGFEAVRSSNVVFNPCNSRIVCRSQVCLEMLENLKLAHDNKGARGEGPLVIVSWNSNNYVVDGTHRIHDWKKEEILEHFSVIEVSLRSEPGGA